MKITISPIKQALIQGCINRNRPSQKQLYGILSPSIYTSILREGFPKQEAEEVLNRIFIEIFNSIEHYNHHISFEDWYMDVCEVVMNRSRH
ncbi:MAG TPA: hypothetical protein VF540_08375, partial [Segetibacter sp.]